MISDLEKQIVLGELRKKSPRFIPCHTAEQADVLRARFYEDKRLATIAAERGISADAVHRTETKALQGMRRGKNAVRLKRYLNLSRRLHYEHFTNCPSQPGLWANWSMRTSPNHIEHALVVAFALVENDCGGGEILQVLRPMCVTKGGGGACFIRSSESIIFHDCTFMDASEEWREAAMSKGHENLIPLNRRTKDAQRKIQSEGGAASAQARRQRKSLKESMDVLLSMPIADKRKLAKAAKMGFDAEDADNSALVIIALFEKAVSGDVPAIKELRSLIDEDTGDNGQLETLINALKGSDDE